MKKIKIYADDASLKKIFDIFDLDQVLVTYYDRLEIRLQGSREQEREYNARLRAESMKNRLTDKNDNPKKGKP